MLGIDGLRVSRYIYSTVDLWFCGVIKRVINQNTLFLFIIYTKKAEIPFEFQSIFYKFKLMVYILDIICKISYYHFALQVIKLGTVVTL